MADVEKLTYMISTTEHERTPTSLIRAQLRLEERLIVIVIWVLRGGDVVV